MHSLNSSRLRPGDSVPRMGWQAICEHVNSCLCGTSAIRKPIMHWVSLTWAHLSGQHKSEADPAHHPGRDRRQLPLEVQKRGEHLWSSRLRILEACCIDANQRAKQRAGRDNEERVSCMAGIRGGRRRDVAPVTPSVLEHNPIGMSVMRSAYAALEPHRVARIHVKPTASAGRPPTSSVARVYERTEIAGVWILCECDLRIR